MRSTASSHSADLRRASNIALVAAVACSFLVLTSPALTVPALATQINYGTHAGTDVTYVNVTEDTGADEPLPLFGPPLVTGNSIDFNPLGFDAASAGVDSDITGSNLVFAIAAHIGSRIDTVSLFESGNTTQTGGVTPGSMGTASAVFAAGGLDIHEVDFAPINHISVPFSLSFTPSGGTYFLGTDGGGLPLYHTLWTGSTTLDVEAILIANGFTDFNGATRVSIDLINQLDAASQAGTAAQISKLDFGAITTGKVVRADIPEPSSVVLAALGLFGLMAVRRRCKTAGRS
jgi:hypothetical protein